MKAGIYGEYRYRSYDQREFIYRYDNLSAEERQYYLKLPFQEMLSPGMAGSGQGLYRRDNPARPMPTPPTSITERLMRRSTFRSENSISMPGHVSKATPRS